MHYRMKVLRNEKHLDWLTITIICSTSSFKEFSVLYLKTEHNWAYLTKLYNDECGFVQKLCNSRYCFCENEANSKVLGVYLIMIAIKLM